MFVHRRRFVPLISLHGRNKIFGAFLFEDCLGTVGFIGNIVKVITELIQLVFDISFVEFLSVLNLLAILEDTILITVPALGLTSQHSSS